jgi:long-chain acyl-CoA synthetase
MVAGLQDFVASKGDEVAVIDEDGQWTWSELDARANALVNGLRERGLQDGDVVALLCGNRAEYLEVNTACTSASWIVVPVNWHFSAEEIAYILENAGARALVADAAFAQKAAEGAAAHDIDLKIMLGGEPAPGFEDYEAIIAGSSSAEPSDPGAGAVMFYTSGTTGRPKGVKSSVIQVGGDPAGLRAILQGLLGVLGIPAEGRVLLNAPAYHAGPWLFCLAPVATGSSIVIRRDWDAEDMLRTIDEHRITTAYAVPTHFVRLLKLPQEVREKFDGSSLEVVFHTAAPCPPEIKRQMIEWWGPVISEMYAASESGGAGTVVTSDDWLTKPGTVGKPLPIAEILIIGDDGEQLGPGEVGQVYVRNLMGSDFEYLGDEEKTKEAHLEPGVFNFGDVGYLDEDGYLFLSDRKIDMIISGGVNIYPAEIESVLITHPAVADVGIFGVPNDEFGEEVKAAVELAPGFDPSDELSRDLQTFVREKLAGYMVPRSFDYAVLPRTPTGKLLKRELRAPYWEGTGRSI